ncbi:MAG: O-antigen ligase family protein [Elusimicrobia bacterium]|nr:O-antigen ligase family protein [Elusimicrobiota bacterium]
MTEFSRHPASLARKAILWWLPLLYLLISDSFYLRTYDSAMVKITLLQMGGAAVVCLWAILLWERRRFPFDQKALVLLAPFFLYLLSGIVSFSHAPYPGSSADDFLRRVFYMSFSMIVVSEFDEARVEWFSRVLTWTAAIAVLYGFIQYLDEAFFPPGTNMGLDPFVWRGAFGSRIFSTFGNPNFFANFLVLIFPIVLTRYLKTRSVALLPLLALVVFDLYRTETKGAWIGFVISAFIFIVLYIFFFSGLLLKKVLRWLLPMGGVALVGISALLFYYVTRRRSSVDFRVFTWLATWEMIETHPWIGTGIGSFKVIYPAFRRPAIFHIEAKHNTETDHSENEYLEVWFDEGVVGFGIFLWLILTVTGLGFSALRRLCVGEAARPPPRAYDILGYLVAFLGMLAHNLFDVSLRFVSSGVYLALLPAVVARLSYFHPLQEAKEPGLNQGPALNQGVPPSDSGPSGLYAAFLWPLKLLCGLGLLYFLYQVFVQFAALQGGFQSAAYGGERLQWVISWTVLLGCCVGLGGFFGMIAYRTSSWITPALILAMLYPLLFFWGFFRADIHHNMAIFYSKRGEWDLALENYLKVNRLNPYFIMAFYFKGNVFNDRFQMERQERFQWGDSTGKPRNDFERALDAYAEVRRIAPNYVQMHHQVGTLYLRRANYEINQKNMEGAEKYWKEALRFYQLYRNLDPVFFLNYQRMAQAYAVRKHWDQAEKMYLDFIQAERCHVHRHETPEAYTLLGNIRAMRQNFRGAEEAYRLALGLDPQYGEALKNLAALYHQTGAQEKLRSLKESYLPKPQPARGSSYELVPSRL